MKEKLSNFVAFVGIDWADIKHDVCVGSTADGKTTSKKIDHTPEALYDWVNQLRQQYPEGQIALALEQSKGALIYNLLGYDFLTLFPINPKSLARFRDALTPSGAKGDPTDADLLREYVTSFNERLHSWEPDDEHTRTIAFFAQGRRKAIDERTRLTSKLRSSLKMYFPQALNLVGDSLYARMALDFLQKWPQLNDAKKAHKKTIQKFYTTHNCRSQARIEERILLIGSSMSLTKDQAVVKSSLMMVKMLVIQISHLNKSIDEFENELKSLYDNHPDKDLFDSFPGSGDAIGPRLIAAWGSNRDRYESANSMQKYSGTAPITKASGKSKIIVRRLACPKFLLQTFHEFAACSLKKSAWAQAFYDMQRDRGKRHHTATRALAFKWIRIMYHCWKNRTKYDEVKYIKALQKSNSPLLKYI